MKANKFFTSLLTLSLVIFGAASGISNTVNNVTGDNLKKSSNTIESAGKSEISVSTVSADPATDFSYLRFDVNNYMNESESMEVEHASLDYLKFDVNDFVNEKVFTPSRYPFQLTPSYE